MNRMRLAVFLQSARDWWLSSFAACKAAVAFTGCVCTLRGAGLSAVLGPQ